MLMDGALMFEFPSTPSFPSPTLRASPRLADKGQGSQQKRVAAARASDGSGAESGVGTMSFRQEQSPCTMGALRPMMPALSACSCPPPLPMHDPPFLPASNAILSPAMAHLIANQGPTITTPVSSGLGSIGSQTSTVEAEAALDSLLRSASPQSTLLTPGPFAARRRRIWHRRQLARRLMGSPLS